MLEARNVTVTANGNTLLRQASVVASPGRTLALIGPNGAGKSTLFNLISGHYVSTAGDILLNGRSITGLSPHIINRLHGAMAKALASLTACPARERAWTRVTRTSGSTGSGTCSN